MAYCTLEEAWGGNYKPSQPKLSVDWVNKPSDAVKRDGVDRDHEYIEEFANINNELDDTDILVDHDEFNIPLHTYSSSKPNDTGIDNYYKLIDEQDTDNRDEYFQYQNSDYAIEPQFGKHYTKECEKVFPEHVKYHLKKCKQCRRRLTKWLGLSETKPKEKHNIREEKNIHGTVFTDKTQKYFDLIFFISFGVFLIFIFDMFVRLGRRRLMK